MEKIEKFIEYLYRDATVFLRRKYTKSIEVIDYLKNKPHFYGGEKIAQYSLGGDLIKIWDNIDEIKNTTNYNIQTILRNIKGNIKTSNNFKFEIYD